MAPFRWTQDVSKGKIKWISVCKQNYVYYSLYKCTFAIELVCSLHLSQLSYLFIWLGVEHKQAGICVRQIVQVLGPEFMRDIKSELFCNCLIKTIWSRPTLSGTMECTVDGQIQVRRCACQGWLWALHKSSTIIPPVNTRGPSARWCYRFLRILLTRSVTLPLITCSFQKAVS